MTKRRSQSGYLVLTLLLTACGGWVRLTDVPPRQLPQFQQAQVWSNQVPYILQEIQITSDTLYGVPPRHEQHCQECRVAIPMTAVDSIRGGGIMPASSMGVGIVAGVVLGYLSLLLLLSGGGT